MIKQIIITPAAGKRLIARALAHHPAVTAALQNGTIVIVAGTTNGYVAEEILQKIGQAKDFSRRRFFRGVILPPAQPTTASGRLPDESEFPGDVIIKHGQWLKGKTIFDVVGELKEGDVILKGANAVDLARREAAVLIGHPQGGTIVAALQAVVGRRVHLIIPVGLEKRVAADLQKLAQLLNQPDAVGARLLPVPGEVFTELEAIAMLMGMRAELVAGGGVNGAEGAIWLAVEGAEQNIQAAHALLDEIAREPAFTL